MRLKSREAREYRRQIIVELSKSGKKQQEIAALLQIHQSVVSRVLSCYDRGESLAEKVNPGAEPKLTKAQQEVFSEMIKKGAEAFGFQGDHWSAPRFISVAEDVFKVKYSKSGIIQLVKRLGFSKQRYQKKDLRQSDKGEWVAEKLPEIKKKLRTKSA